MPVTSQQICWLAGLIEGEGYIGCGHKTKNTARIYVGMRDEDVVSKARGLMAPEAKIGVVKGKRENHSTIYCFNVTGELAIQWMMTIYSLMGRRRKEQIRETISRWHEAKYHIGKYVIPKTNRVSNETAIKLIANFRKITIEEATEIFNKSLETVQ